MPDHVKGEKTHHFSPAAPRFIAGFFSFLPPAFFPWLSNASCMHASGLSKTGLQWRTCLQHRCKPALESQNGAVQDICCKDRQRKASSGRARCLLVHRRFLVAGVLVKHTLR